MLSSVSPSVLSVVAFAGEDRTKILCILDSAAGQTTVDEDFARSAGLLLSEPRTRHIAYLDRQVTLTTLKCRLTLYSQDGKFSCEVQAEAGFRDHCHLWPWSNFLANHPHLADIDIPSYPLPPRGSVLIGTDNPDLLVASEH